MYEIVVPLYASFVLLCVFVWMSNTALKTALMGVTDLLDKNGKVEVSLPPTFIETLKDDMFDIVQEIVQDTVGGMSPPSASDHLMGMLTQMVQVKMAQAMGPLQQILPGIAGDVSEEEL